MGHNDVLIGMGRPIANLLIRGGGVFLISWIFLGFENWSFQWLSIGKTSIFKILMIDDVTYFVVKTRIYMVSLLDFYRASIHSRVILT